MSDFHLLELQVIRLGELAIQIVRVLLGYVYEMEPGEIDGNILPVIRIPHRCACWITAPVSPLNLLIPLILLTSSSNLLHCIMEVGDLVIDDEEFIKFENPFQVFAHHKSW